jgi:hypothetical protein
VRTWTEALIALVTGIMQFRAPKDFTQENHHQYYGMGNTFKTQDSITVKIVLYFAIHDYVPTSFDLQILYLKTASLNKVRIMCLRI